MIWSFNFLHKINRCLSLSFYFFKLYSLMLHLTQVTAVFTVWNSCNVGLCFDLQTRLFQFSLLYSFCSSVRDFASTFLQIPPHGGHPCHQLTVPTAKPVVDFHHQVIAHAGRTSKPLGNTIQAVLSWYFLR